MFSVLAKNVLVPLLLRFALAAIFIFHGLNLIGFSIHGQNLVHDPDNQWGAQWNASGDAPPAVVQLGVAWGQLIGGIAMVFGFLTRLAAIGLIVVMAGAIAVVHWQNGFDIRQGGFEYNFAIIMMCLCLVLGGPGPLAVDRFIRIKRKTT